MNSMHGVHLRNLDLNLIVALDALLEERNVTRAAERIGITQSAMSHALARLRALTGDALLVRASGKMVLTARAMELAPPVRRALSEIAEALRPTSAFEPRTANAKIRIAMSDYGEVVLIPTLVRHLAREAPGIDLRVTTHVDDARDVLIPGAIDLFVGLVRPRDIGPGIFAKKLFDEKFVCVVRKGHRLAKGRLTVARFAEASHALISPRGKEGGFVDDALALHGLSRRVSVVVPHFLVAPYVVATSDLVLTVAGRIAKMLAKPLELAILSPPRELGLEGFTTTMLWHERTRADPAHKWMREAIVRIARSI